MYRDVIGDMSPLSSHFWSPLCVSASPKRSRPSSFASFQTRFRRLGKRRRRPVGGHQRRPASDRGCCHRRRGPRHDWDHGLFEHYRVPSCNWRAGRRYGDALRASSGLVRHSRWAGAFSPAQLASKLGEGEITDKGYLNQRAILQRRRALVDELCSSDDHLVQRGPRHV